MPYVNIFKVQEAVVAAEKKHSAELCELEEKLRNGFAQVSQILRALDVCYVHFSFLLSFCKSY